MWRALQQNMAIESSKDNRWRDGGELRWLYIDMNSFFASCEQQCHKHLRKKPIIIVPTMSDYTCAIAASYEAKAFGIKTGTSVLEAKQKCPNLAIVEARPDVYVRIHHQIEVEIDKVIPIHHKCSIDEFACLLMGPEKLEENARKIGHNVQKIIMENVGECLTASVGIAPSKLLAKTACDIVKPLGLTILRMDELPGKLLDLEINDFAGIGASMTKRLLAAGVCNVKTLWHQSPSRMRKLWGGIVGENFYYALHGIDPPELVTTRSSISHSHVLAGPLRPVKDAYNVARRLVAKCGSRMRRMLLKCSRLHLSIRGDKSGRTQALAQFDATSDSFKLLDALKPLWIKCVRELGAKRIKKISITCLSIVEITPQEDLFGWSLEAQENQKHMNILTALDKLNSRYGKDTITIGPKTKLHNFVGAKIAFNRIPEINEFHE